MPGDIPGDMFTMNAIDSFVKFHPGTQVELFVTKARVLGTVVRDDLELPPSDVRAVVRTSGETLDEETLDEEVIARCDWRAPYVQPEI